MLQTTFTNFRTLSFAFVMVAMLMVGTMAPVHSASAQEAGPAERAAMMEQINVLMGLIAQLMSQLQMMQTTKVEVDRQTVIAEPDKGWALKEEVESDTEKAEDEIEKAEDEIEAVLEDYYGEYEDIAEDLGREKEAQALINTFNFQLEFAKDQFQAGKYDSVGNYTDSALRHVTRFEKFLEELDDEEELDPKISLISPNGRQTFDKSKRNDDIVIKWETEDVPANTNVIIEIELVEAYAGTFITGGVTQVRAKEGVQEHRKAIDIDGTLGAGEYKVRLALEECHSTGCNSSYTFGPLKESLKVYDQSRYGYFIVVDTGLSDVRLKVSGYGDPDNIDLDIEDRVTVNHYPVGDIDECVVTGEYEKGNQISKSSWPNTIKAGQYGRTYFSAVGVKGVLEEVRVECEDRSGRTIATDSISFTVDRGSAGSYEILFNGEVVESDRSATEADAQSACRATYNDYDKYNFDFGDVVECKWNGKVFETVDAWKG